MAKKKVVRFVKGYPQRDRPMIRRLSRGPVKFADIRQERPRIHARPWRYRTGYDLDLLREQKAEQGIRGSLEERIVYKALSSFGFIPGVDFDFQSSMLGCRGELGGLVADFLFPSRMVIVQVQSYWHTITLALEKRDDDQATILESMGYTILEIWPITIHDPFALDKWISDNISVMWGIGTTGIGAGSAGTTSWLTSIEQRMLNQIDLTLDAIIERIDDGS